MFKHQHPYPPFIPENATKLIVGTLPPPRFSTGELLENDVDFCYGSYFNSLWKYIEVIFELELRYDNSTEAIEQRKRFLKKQGIGICDIVEHCERTKIDASDLGMNKVVLRDVIKQLKVHPGLKRILFIGGSSKNGPEYFFRRHIRDYNLKLKLVDKTTPRIHKFYIGEREIETVSLTSSSGAANISIGSNPEYKRIKARNPEFTTFDFRVRQYRNYF